MSTSKVLKNSAPHQVKMREGSKDAQRKPMKAPVEKTQLEAPSQRKVKVLAEPVKAAKPVKVTPAAKAVKALKPVKPTVKPVKAPAPAAAAVPVPVAVVVPASIAKKPRAKAKALPQVQEKPTPVDSSPKPTVTAPPPVTRAPVPEHELWEADSPVMRRISLLRTRNAQLSEQVQRLKKPA
jgi:hypothetical protein